MGHSACNLPNKPAPCPPPSPPPLPPSIPKNPAPCPPPRAPSSPKSPSKPPGFPDPFSAGFTPKKAAPILSRYCRSKGEMIHHFQCTQHNLSETSLQRTLVPRVVDNLPTQDKMVTPGSFILIYLSRVSCRGRSFSPFRSMPSLKD